MSQFAYPATIEQDEAGFFLVHFPDLPGAATDAPNRDEALLEARDCLAEAIAFRIHSGLEIPSPSRGTRGQVSVALSAQMAAKAALYLAVSEAGMNKSDLARRLGCDEKEVRRMLDPRHPTKLPRIEEALAVLGKRLSVSLESA